MTSGRNGLLGAAAVAVLWELAALAQPTAIAAPIPTLVRLATSLVSGDLTRHAAFTLGEAGAGFAIGAPAAIVLPLLLRRHETVRRVLDPFLVAAYGAPKMALAPLFVLWLGIGLASKVLLVALVVFFLIFFMTSGGVLAVPESLVASARVLGASEALVLREVVWPSTVPYVLAGVRIAAPHAIGAAVVAELISSNRGLGYAIHAAAVDFDTEGVFAAMLLLVVVVGAITAAFNLAAARVLSRRHRSGVSMAGADARATV